LNANSAQKRKYKYKGTQFPGKKKGDPDFLEGNRAHPKGCTFLDSLRETGHTLSLEKKKQIGISSPDVHKQSQVTRQSSPVPIVPINKAEFTSPN
jgi:hypothetical protein